MKESSSSRQGDTLDARQGDSRFARLFQIFRHRVLRRPAQDGSLRQLVEEAIEEHGDSAPASNNDLGDAERAMLRNVLDYGELRVNDVTVPRADIIAFDVGDSFDDLVKLFADCAHSRVPVYRETLDGIIGMIHVKDVMPYLAASEKPRPRIDQLLRSVLFVPPSMRVLDLLARMRISRVHMAIVVDEYGGADGLVTIEDLVEQIVGDIEDEHDDDPTQMMLNISPDLRDVDARLPLGELEAVLNVDFLDDEEDEEIDTVGGLIFMLAGRVPTIGETIEYDKGYRFEIVDGDPRRITRVRVHGQPQETGTS
jgi:CBS domain containing-hemolysin-like protein